MNLPAMSEGLLASLVQVQNVLLAQPQVELDTDHFLHGGMYARTIVLPAKVELPGYPESEVVMEGCLVKVPSILIVKGWVAVFTGESWIELRGLHVIPARAGRKQIFVTREETSITMIFRTDAVTVAEAEEEFTDEAEALMSRKTGEQ